MEISVEKAETSDIPKKPRSLDLQSIYVKKSRISDRKSLSRKEVSVLEQESKVSKKKKKLVSTFEEAGEHFSESRKQIRKEVSLSSLEPGPKTKRQRNSSNAPKPKHDFVSCLEKRDVSPSGNDATHNLGGANGNANHLGSDLHSCLLKKTDHTCTSDGSSKSKSYLNKDLIIPKRPRGISKWRKAKDSVSLETSIDNSCQVKTTDVQHNGSSVSGSLNSQVLDDKQKKKIVDFEPNGFHKDDSAPCNSVEDENYIMDGERMAKNRKDNLKLSEQTSLKNDAHMVDDRGHSAVNSQEDDEENLEENAARMLSSRFDPSCTSFSGKRACTADPVKASSFLQSDHDRLMDSQAEACSVDAPSRVLRPRRHNGKSFARKRRHFYEVCSRDMDPYCVVKQRIRVFWPLDKNWYFGLVKDYDPVTRLHHVKYDDREEEWINLQNERFKLLLFPSEVSSRLNFGKTSSESNENKTEEVAESVENGYIGSLLESEPIISWLARTTRRVTSSPSSTIKKHLRVRHFKDRSPSFSKPKEHMSTNVLEKRANKLLANCNESGQSCDKNINGISEQKRSIDSKDRKLPYVYYRKRFRNKKEFLEDKEIHDVGHCAPGGSMNTLSVANGTTATEEYNNIFTSTELKEVIFELSLLPQCTLELAFEAESFWLFRSLYILHHGKLVCASPIVQMEIFFIDSILGLRFLLFEGCLKCAVSLFCLIITTVDQHVVKANFNEPEISCLSLGLRISNLNNSSKNLLFVLNLFSKMESSKWRYLEAKLKRHCRKKALATAEYTCSNDQDLPCSEPFHNSVKSHKRFWRRSESVHRSNLSDSNSNVRYSYEEMDKFFPCSVFFATGSSFSLNLYLKLLVEKGADSRDDIVVSSEKNAGDADVMVADGCSYSNDPSKQASVKHTSLGPSLSQSAGCHARPNIDDLATGNDGDLNRSSDNIVTSEVSVIENAIGCTRDVVKSTDDDSVIHFGRSLCEVATPRYADMSYSQYPEQPTLEKPHDGGSSSCINSTNVEVQLPDEAEKHSIEKRLLVSRPTSNLFLEMNEYAGHSPTAPRSLWHRNRHTSLSRTFIQRPKLGSEDLVANGFSSGYKRPRSQVSYSHSGSYEHAAKHRSNHQKVQPHKKVKTLIANVSSESSSNPQSFLDSLTCNANVLVTHGDKCWREFGAKVQLDCDDQKSWRLCVKVSGVTKYVYKPHHVLQPGTANRYTHAMMWKGGKEWTLEFTDRNHWYFFKQMHEECYNQNIRAASVKNIPIPGVRLLSDGDDGCVEVPFMRSSSKYFRQIGTEVDLALDPSCILYDMDSEDEEWLSSMRVSMNAIDSMMPEVTEDTFERVMDMLEKLAYTQQCEELTDDDIETYLDDVGPAEFIKFIYEHWKQKRKRKGLPLIRQFQPPLWERYQQQVKEWESNMSRMPFQCEGWPAKEYSTKKPPMFAFCLRPRGLEIPNRGSKQRSHKKLMFTGHHNALMREQDGFHTFGRKMDVISVGDAAVSSYESSDSYHGFQSRSTFSPRDTASTESLFTYDGSERCPDPRFYRSTSKKFDAFLSPRDPQGTPFSSSQRSNRNGDAFLSPRDPHGTPFSSNQRSNRNGINRWNSEFSEWSSSKQAPSTAFQRHYADVDDLRLRDATTAAQHASNMAKLKREKAQWLLHKADLALHRATVALITAEAIKSSEKDSVGDG
ncbi:hypothetical protein Cni_G17780 [Canna indica]|uniref:Enhancer of polycomb-like protein n=1 Tax=Canna indica TaxID=4628 RepID=A0AAQ3KI35_9LILI|nr:hypothetical protein Cni_G17780 [Canna indica]